MKEISRKRFDAYVDFTRNPFIFRIGEEKHWYENDACTLFGVILLDFIDNDYSSILLGRDESRKIRAIEVQISFADEASAQKWIFDTAKKLEKSGVTVFPQGDKSKSIDLFAPIADKSNINPYFDIVNTKSTHTSAKALISEIAPHFYDIDGNLVEQFQTQGFDSRLWELYLFCYFNEEYLQIDRTHNAPDFMLSNGEHEIALEAVTVGRKAPPKPFEKIDLTKIATKTVEEETENAMPIRYGSPLYTKLTYRPKGSGLHYWEYPHTIGKPFVIAIADFHEDFSMTWSTTALTNYLYGYRYSHFYDDNGKLIITPQKIEVHINPDTGKEILSGFFFQPDTENISAILHTTSGTVSKFNRIGKQCGFDENDITMIRTVAFHNHDPNASKPHIYQYPVTEECEETWGEGVSIYHNPNAKYPLPKDFFSSAAQHFFEDKMIISQLPNIYVYSSFTTLFSIKDKD